MATKAPTTAPVANTPDGATPFNGGGYKDLTTTQLVQRTDEELSRQEEQLDRIHHGVKNLKYHAQVINEEVVRQIVVIQDVDEKIDIVQDDLDVGIERARVVNENHSKECRLYFLVAALVAVDVLVHVAIP